MLDARSLYLKPFKPWEYSLLNKPKEDAFLTQDMTAKEAYIKGVLDALMWARNQPDKDPIDLAKPILERLIEL